MIPVLEFSIFDLKSCLEIARAGHSIVDSLGRGHFLFLSSKYLKEKKKKSKFRF